MNHHNNWSMHDVTEVFQHIRWKRIM